MLTKKRLSSKINYDVLDKLFDEPGAPEISKKSKTESDYNEDDPPHDNRRDSELEDDTFEDVGVTGEAYSNDFGYENMEGYDYDDDYGDDEY